MMKIINFFGDILGHLLGYGTCMNCHGSFLYKERGSINYAHITDLEHGEGQVGFMICQTCLLDPNGLNKEKIVSRMTKAGWKEDDIAMAIHGGIDKHNLSLTK